MEKIALQLKEILPNALVGAATYIVSQFESTESFMFALFLGFTFNVLAGLRADDVFIKMFRLCNFNGHKLKDSLIELFFIVLTTYFLKITADLMGETSKSIELVKWLVWVALYYYVTNGLKNLSRAYPRNQWIKFLYYLISFQFSEFAPESIKKAWSKSKDDINNKNTE